MYKYSEGCEALFTLHPDGCECSGQPEWKGPERYFGKLGVLECYNVIILFKDSEVAERNGVKPRRAISTVSGHFWERYMQFSSKPPQPSNPSSNSTSAWQPLLLLL